MPDKIDIVRDPAVLAGKPTIRGTRISVEFVLELLAEGWSESDITREFPTATHEGIAACLRYARDLIVEHQVSSVA